MIKFNKQLFNYLSPHKLKKYIYLDFFFKKRFYLIKSTNELSIDNSSLATLRRSIGQSHLNKPKLVKTDLSGYRILGDKINLSEAGETFTHLKGISFLFIEEQLKSIVYPEHNYSLKLFTKDDIKKIPSSGRTKYCSSPNDDVDLIRTITVDESIDSSDTVFETFKLLETSIMYFIKAIENPQGKITELGVIYGSHVSRELLSSE